MSSENQIRHYREVEKRFWNHFQAQPRERYIRLEKQDIRVRVLEIGQGPPVLFIHGGPNSGSTWAPIVHAMRDFHCIILDRPGCGLSEAVDYQRIDSLQDFAVDVLGSVLDELQVQKTSIVASSFGSAWALWFAEAHPERVDRIVHEGCPPFLEGSKPSLFMRLMMIGPLGRMIARQTATEASQEMTFRQLGHRSLIESGKFLPVFVEWGLSMMNETETMKNEVSVIQSASTWTGFRSDLTHDPAFLRRIPHPTLFLWGEEDPFGTVEVGLRACRALPNAQFHSFPDSGHLPWLDDPETHVGMIRPFLRSA